MNRVRGIPRHFRFPWRTTRQIHREVDEELAFHFHCRIDELCASGLDPEEAEQIAHGEFGDLADTRRSLKAHGRRHESRRRRELMFNELFRDIRYAWRSLARSPGFTAIAVLVMALGIGATATIFTLLNTMLMRPTLVEEPDRLVGIYSQDIERTDNFRSFSYPTYVDLREHNQVFSELVAYTLSAAGLKEGTQTRRIMTGVVSSSYFEALGVPPVQGRGFTLEEERPGGGDVVVVSHAFWQRMGGGPLLGTTIDLNGNSLTIVGITAEGFSGSNALFSPQVWLPLGLYERIYDSLAGGQAGQKLNDRENNALMLFGRLRKGVDEEDAAPQLAALAERLRVSYPKALENQTFITSPMPRLVISTQPDDESHFLGPSIMLMAMAGVVLLIACLNLANMFLARGAGRRTELAIRLSLGGSRARLLRQLLCEGLVLALIGGAIGLLVAVYGIKVLLTSISLHLPLGLDLSIDPSPDWRVIGATLVFCLIATVLSGFGPAWKLSGGDVLGGLKETFGQSLSGGGKRRRATPRNLMVIGQIALSMMLLAAGGLFVRGSWLAAEADPGFSLKDSVLVELDTSLVGYDEAQGRNTYSRVLERLRALPGVESVGMSSIVPLGAVTSGRSVLPAGVENEDDAILANRYIVSDGYFDSLRLGMLHGREFTSLETTSDEGTPVAIVNQQLADQLWPNEPAVGQLMQVVSRGPGEPLPPLKIVGVAPGFRHQLIDDPPRPHYFLPYGQNFRANMHFHLRLADGAGDGTELAQIEAVRHELQALDSVLPVLAVKTMTDHRDESVFLWLFSSAAKIFTALGAVALFLALVGVYGVKAFMVTYRTREIGLRLALGATPRQILKQMVRESLNTTLIALGFGLVLALGAAKVLGSLIYEFQRGSIGIILAAAVLLTLASTLAAYLPARRATKIEPTTALRQD